MINEKVERSKMLNEQVERLKEFKKNSGWTFQKISNLIGVHSQSLINWFSGYSKPSRHVSPLVEKFLKKYSYNQAKDQKKGNFRPIPRA
ncbi:hypothetical protein ES703_28658 [subsurface metagenome]